MRGRRPTSLVRSRSIGASRALRTRLLAVLRSIDASRALLPFVLVMIGSPAVQATSPDALGESRLFFSAAERLAIDGKSPVGSSPQVGRVVEDAEDKSGSDSDEASSRLAQDQGAGPSGKTALAHGRPRNLPPLRRIGYTGMLSSSQGQTFLINGVPWQPGAHEIRSISRDAATGQIELRFETGDSAVLSLGQSLERGVRP